MYRIIFKINKKKWRKGLFVYAKEIAEAKAKLWKEYFKDICDIVEDKKYIKEEVYDEAWLEVTDDKPEQLKNRIRKIEEMREPEFYILDKAI